jgi:ArsR family transcriptional regulator
MKKSASSLSRCCAPVLQSRLGKSAADQVATVFKAIADPARLRLLSFIAAQPSGESCVCYLTKPLGLSQPTVSHHLKVMHDAGLLTRERLGTWVYYRIVPQQLAALRDVLAGPGETAGLGDSVDSSDTEGAQKSVRSAVVLPLNLDRVGCGQSGEELFFRDEDSSSASVERLPVRSDVDGIAFGKEAFSV